MLKIISYRNISKTADLFFGQHKLRHQEFIERQRYDVKTFDGMEFDEYDTLASSYIVYSDDGKHVLGCSRLTPIAYGCMLRDHFPDLVDDHKLFEAQDVWEGTRFCIDSALPAPKRLAILQQISLAYIEFGLLKGASKIIGLMPTLILRSVFERHGIELERLGTAHQIGKHAKIQAASISISREQLYRATQRTGFSDVLGTKVTGLGKHAA